jgi:ABC-type transporter Mla subunit MlaD
MKSKLNLSRIAGFSAGLLLAGTLGLWAFTGASLGWTKTSRVTMHHDDVTGIDYPVHQPAFVAGVEVLAIGVAAALGFAATAMATRPVRA